MMMNNAQKKRRNTKEKEALKKRFKSAKTTDEMLKIFMKMESCFEEKELGMECMKLASNFLSESPEKVVSFGKRALKIFIDTENESLLCSDETAFEFLFTNMNVNCHSCGHVSSLHIASVLILLGLASLDLNRLNECLSYVNWAVRNLGKLQDKHSFCPGKCVLQMLLATELVLVQVKQAMGKGDEVVVHFRKILEIKEQTMEAGCVNIGEANEDVYCAYFLLVRDSKEALPFCLKALEIYRKHLGVKSVKVARTRKHLADIYRDLGEYEKALEQDQLSGSVETCSYGRRKMEIDNGNKLLELGRNEEAVNVLKDVVSRTNDEEKELRACALVYMAKAFFNLEKFAEAKKCLRKVRGMLEKKRMDPTFVPFASGEMSLLYEKMNNFETAISLMRNVVAIPELPHELLVNSSSRLFMLISLSGKEKEGIPYIEDAVEILKKRFGPEHSQVALGYRILGRAYLRSGQQTESAVKLLENAKTIMDASLGHHHFDSLTTSADLSSTYANLGRFQIAIEIQETVVEGFNSLGPSEQKYLEDAVKILNRMKREAESLTGDLPQAKNCEDLCSAISNCGILGDGKGH